MVKIAFKSIGKKVFFAFIILIILGLAAFLYSYLSVLSISKTLSDGPASTHKLTLINQTLVRIYESESNARLYSATNDPQYLASYLQQNQEIDSSLQVLRNISYNSEQQLQLVNILVLQMQKGKVISDLIDLKKTKISQHDFAVLFKNRPDSFEVESKQKVYSSSNMSAAAESPVKKRSFFERLKAVFKGDEKPVSAQINAGLQHKVDSATFKQVRKDHNIADLKSRIVRMRNEEQRAKQVLEQKEIDLMLRDKVLTDRLLYQITKLSREEIGISRKQVEKFEVASGQYSSRFLLLGLSSMFVLMIFLVLIIRDLKKNVKMQRLLEESNDKIQELLKVKERFLANMSHEIRTPLAAIIGFSEMLLKKKKYSEVDINAINTSAKHLHSIVNEILDYSKVESNKVELENTVFSPDLLFREVVTEMSVKAREKGVKIKLTLGIIPEYVQLDRLRLKQVLLNLISNAIKFTDKGEVVVNAGDREGNLIVEVIDTGIGISKAAQEKIFDEFTQADSSVARKFGGTGLGLSISRKLVNLMGGELTLSSKENVGSTFTIIFNVDAIACEKPAEVAAVSVPLFRKPKRLLFIDDDNFVRLLIRKILEANDFTFDEAESGAQGIEMAKNGSYDFLITDLHMPGMTGVEVVSELHAANPEIKVLFLSADVSVSMVGEMKSVGADGILQKPFSEDELLNAIGRIMEDGKETPAMAGSEMCDIEKVKAFIGDDPKELSLIVETFVASADEAIQFIEDNRKEVKKMLVADKAHKLLTGFRQFGIAQGVECLRKIERCREGLSIKEVDNDINILSSIWKEVRLYLNSFVVKD